MTAGTTDFPATHWSLVLSAAAGQERSREALEALLQAYWPPLYAFLRLDGHDPEAAKDLLQGYLARLIERDDLAQVGPERGRFRSYLLTGLRNHLVSERRRQHAAKRGGGAVVSFETEEARRQLELAPAKGVTPEAAFDRRWAAMVLERALDRLHREHQAQNKLRLFEALKPSLTGDGSEDYGALAGRLGLTAGAVAVAVHRLRRRLRELVRFEVSQTVGSASELESEMRHLLAAWND